MKSGGETATREYRQSARAAAAAQTATDILDAAFRLYWHTPIEELTLALVAENAGVTVQTVIRRFGSKDELIAALAERERDRVVASREVTSDVSQACFTVPVFCSTRSAEPTLMTMRLAFARRLITASTPSQRVRLHGHGGAHWLG